MEEVVKQFSISLDTKRPTSNRDFEVVDGDNGNVIEITLTDDGQPVDLADCFILAVFSKSDGRTASQDNHGNGITVDEAHANRLYIRLYTTSFAPGLVECELQVYSGEGGRTLATTAKFNFLCRRGIANRDTLPETDEWPLLVNLMERVEAAQDGLHNLNEETADAAAQAHTAANRANTAAARAEQNNTSFEAAEAQRVIAETARRAAEDVRLDAEAVRAAAEDERQDAEDDRLDAEHARQNAETARASAEAQRLADEQARISAELARSARDTSFSVWEEYNPQKAYKAFNKVSYGGSSYLCVKDVADIPPPSPEYWLLIAAKGADGIGSGDMLKSTYDKNDTGVVDDAQRLGGRPASDYLTTGFTEADPTVPAWAKQPEKPAYTAAEVGAAGAVHAATHHTGGADALTPGDIGAADIPVIIQASITTGWSGTAQTITDTAIKAASAGSLRIAQTATADEFKQFGELMPQVTAQADSTITITYRGKVNTIAIPVEIEVRS